MKIATPAATWDDIAVGDPLPTVVKGETQATINDYSNLAHDRKPNWKSLHSDEEYSRERSIFGATVNMGVATFAYFAEVVQEAFGPRRTLSEGTRLKVKATNPVYAGDTVTFAGTVTGMREDGGRRLVDVEITGVNQKGITVGLATGTVIFS